MKNKFFRKFFSIILVLVTILSSSSLLFACKITEYVGKARVVFVSKELDISQARNRIDTFKEYFENASRTFLSRLVNYYGPLTSNLSNFTASMLNLVQHYTWQYDINQILSTMTWTSWHTIPLTSQTVNMLVLSNYPIYSSSETQTGVSKLSDFFSCDGDAMRVGNNISRIYLISGAGTNVTEADSGDTLPTFSSGSWVGNNVYLYQYDNSMGSTENVYNPRNKVALFILSDSLTTQESAVNMVNSFYTSTLNNVMWLDRRELSTSSIPNDGTPVQFANAQRWLVPLEYDFNANYTNVFLASSSNGAGVPSPLFLQEVAHLYYEGTPVSDAVAQSYDYPLDPNAATIGNRNRDMLAAYLVKDYFFGPDGGENAQYTLSSANHVYINKNNVKDEEINSVIKDMSFADLYNKVIDPTQTKANGAALDFYGNYDLFISTVLFDVYKMTDFQEYESRFKTIIREKIIGVADSPLDDDESGSFHRGYYKYVEQEQFIVKSSDLTFTPPAYTKTYNPVMSKSFCPSSKYGDEQYAVNNKVDIAQMADLQGKELNSIIIYGYAKEISTEVEDPFENDNDAREEFKQEYEESQNIVRGADAGFALQNVGLMVTISSQQELQPTYNIVVRIYNKRDKTRVTESVAIATLTRDGNTSTYTLDYRYGGSVGCYCKTLPLGDLSGVSKNSKKNDPLGTLPYCGSSATIIKQYMGRMSAHYKLQDYGNGFYYKGVSDYANESFVEILFPSSAANGEMVVTLNKIVIQ